MKSAHLALLIALLVLASSAIFAFDPNPLQDFCVAINDTKIIGVFVNGEFCKDPKLVNANDFFFSGLKQGDISDPFGINVALVDVTKILGLNTLGVSLARVDFAPKGLNPPHIHPRATEIIVVLEGTLLAGFVTSNPIENRLFTKILNKGDVFVFPIGLIHFQLNVGDKNAAIIAGFNSQNPGFTIVANNVFGSNPPISLEVLAKAFQVDEKIIKYIEKHF